MSALTSPLEDSMTAREKLTDTLTSRRFWAAVIASVGFGLAHDWEMFGFLWMSFIGADGMVEAFARHGAYKSGTASSQRVRYAP